MRTAERHSFTRGRRPVLQVEEPSATPRSIAELCERFAGEWVLVKITDYGEHHHPIRGHLIAHSSSNRSVCRMLDIAMEVPKSSEQPYYLFAANNPLPPGTNPRDVFAALAEEDADRDWQPPRPKRSEVILDRQAVTEVVQPPRSDDRCASACGRHSP